mmetsp:Transcript_118227/g.294994  ORF Transcript_118227/g.294994 Transcript_118227/m.294994 type:complete len:211 (+) Transcript_118227:493-1125(+)
MDVVEGESALDRLRIHGPVGIDGGDALPGIAHPLPNLCELVAREAPLLGQDRRQIEGDIEVENVKRVLYRYLQEERVRWLCAREELARSHEKRGLPSGSRCNVWDNELLGWCEAKGVLVDLDREAIQHHWRCVGEGHVQLDLPAFANEIGHHTEPCLATLSCLRGLENWHLWRCSWRWRSPQHVVATAEVQQVKTAAAAATAASIATATG